MNNVKNYAGIGAVIVAVVAGGFFSAAATAQSSSQTPTPGTAPVQAGPHPTRVMGKVSAVGPNSITLTTRNGDITANVGANTWIVVGSGKGNSQGTISSIQKDKVAAVAGMTTGDPKVIDARVVTEGVKLDGSLGKQKHEKGGKHDLAGHAASGTVKSVNGGLLTVTTEKGKDVDVATTADTIVLNNGLKAVSSIAVGSKVQVLGRPEAKDKAAPVTPGSRQITAWALRVENAGTQLNAGHITAVTGNTFTLNTHKNSDGLTVTVDANTVYKSLNVSTTDRKVSLGNATQADLKADSKVIVDGKISADGKTLNATTVIILPNKGTLKEKPKA